MDSITLITGCIAVWLCASLIWTDTKKSVFELLNMLSFLVLFTAARTVPMALIAVAFFAVGLIFATSQMYHICVKRREIDGHAYYSFGNGNHTGAFMLMELFIGLWLAVNLSPWLLAFLPLIIAALITTKCKGAILATVLGVVAVIYAAGFWQVAMGLFAVVWIAAFLVFCKVPYHFEKSFLNRKEFWKAAIELIRRRPFHGWGLNTYAKELPETAAILNTTRPAVGKRSYRVHNDHLEIMVELGIVGYVLFGYLFSNLSYDPIIFGLFMAFIVHACFFFPFREVHTGAPFWAIIGAMTGGTTTVLSAPWLVKLMVCAIVTAIIIRTLKVFLGQWYSEMAKNKAGITLEQKLAHYEIALANDPDDTGYLTDAAFLYFKVDPIKALLLMMRSFVNYDGVRMKHDICDMLARCIINAGESRICHWLEDEALRLEKDDKSAIEVKNFLYMRDKR